MHAYVFVSKQQNVLKLVLIKFRGENTAIIEGGEGDEYSYIRDLLSKLISFGRGMNIHIFAICSLD